MSPVPWDRSATVDKMAAAMDQVARNFPWVDLVLFHELCASGVAQFAPGGPSRWQDLAEPIPGPTAERLAAVARQHRPCILARGRIGRALSKAVPLAPVRDL